MKTEDESRQNKKKWYVGMFCRIESKKNYPASCFKEVG